MKTINVRAALFIGMLSSLVAVTRGQNELQQLSANWQQQQQQQPTPVQNPQSSFFDRARVMPAFLVRYQMQRRRQLEQELQQLVEVIHFVPDHEHKTRIALIVRYMALSKKLYPQYTDEMRMKAAEAAFSPRAAVPPFPLQSFA